VRRSGRVREAALSGSRALRASKGLSSSTSRPLRRQGRQEPPPVGGGGDSAPPHRRFAVQGSGLLAIGIRDFG